MTSPLDMNAKKIKDLRLSLGLSQQQFAKRIGIHWRMIQQWEKEGQVPTAAAQELLRHIAEDDCPYYNLRLKVAVDK